MIVNVEIKRVYNDPNSQFRASADIVLEEVFIIRNVRLFISNKPFIVMPSVTNRNGRKFSACHPITKEFNAELVSVVLNAYNDYIIEHGMTTPEDDNSEAEIGLEITLERDDESETDIELDAETLLDEYQESDDEAEQ